MSRHEGKFDAAHVASVDIAELLSAMGAHGGASALDRRRAIASVLSGEDGWRDAIDILGGAFASDEQRPGLRKAQEE